MATDKYKAAYERQKLARAQAEQLLEEKSRELYEANQSLRTAYEKLKEQKSHIFHQEKLASVGLLGAGVAHEVNNPLGYIKSNISIFVNYADSIQQFNHALNEILEKELENKPETKKQIDELKIKYDIDYIVDDSPGLTKESLDGVSHIEHIVKSLKDFSRPDPIDKEDVDLNACVQRTLTLTQNETKYKTEVKTDLNEIPFICGKSGAISQVILNLVVNACQAIDDFGELIIKTSADDKFATLTVSDTGCGIPEDKLVTIFDPFYTTKANDQGTGLGLSVSHSIVKQHGGRIQVESEVGKGTTFSIILPLGSCAS